MIGKSSSVKNFRKPIKYITNPEKAEWVEARNLPSCNAHLAISEMELTAGRNNRVKNPAYHLKISWYPDDAPTKPQMLHAVEKTLQKLQLDQHQALLAKHHDTEHPHVHVVVNRVHPETEKATKLWRDHYKIRDTMKKLEKEYDWKRTRDSGKGTDRDFRVDQFKGKVNKALAASGVENPNYRTIEERTSKIKPSLEKATSWRDFDGALAQERLWVRRKGNGMVITDGVRAMKASSVSREFSRGMLETKFGENLSRYESRREANIQREKGEQIIKQWMDLSEKNELKKALEMSKQHQMYLNAKVYELTNIDKDLNNALDKAESILKEVYYNEPEEAFEKFKALIKDEGFEKAANAVVSNPDLLGEKYRADFYLENFEKEIPEKNFYFRKWEKYVDTNLVRDPEHRKKELKYFEDKKSKLENIILPSLQQSMRLLNEKTPKNEVSVDLSLQEFISVSRALKKIAKSPSAILTEAGKKAIHGIEKSNEKSDAHQAVKGTYKALSTAARLTQKIAALKTGGLSVTLSAFQHSITNHLVREKKRARERSFDISR